MQLHHRVKNATRCIAYSHCWRQQLGVGVKNNELKHHYYITQRCLTSSSSLPRIVLSISDPISKPTSPNNNNNALPQWLTNTEPNPVTEHDIRDAATALGVSTNELPHKMAMLASQELKSHSTTMSKELRFLLSFGCKAQYPAITFLTALYLLGEYEVATPEINMETNINKSEPQAAKEVIHAIRTLQRQNQRRAMGKEPPPEIIPTQSQPWGIELMQRSAKLGHVPALLYLGTLSSSNVTERIKWLHKAVECSKSSSTDEVQGQALYALGAALYEDSSHMAEAVKAFEQAANLNDSDALFFLGHLNHVGLQDHIAVNEEHAKHLLTNAAKFSDSGEAELYLAKWMKESGEVDDGMIVSYLVAACKKNNAEAMHVLADAHLTGDLGLPRDEKRALMLYETAGECGSMDAFLSAGALCLQNSDDDVKKRTYELYIRAAHAGSVEAWRRIAALYMKGEGGVQKDVDFAEKILREVTSTPPSADIV